MCEKNFCLANVTNLNVILIFKPGFAKKHIREKHQIC